MFPVMIAVMFGVIIALLIILVATRARLSMICEYLNDINRGNTNRRFFIHASDPLMTELTQGLNTLTENFRLTLDQKEFLEESRKKMIADMAHDLRTPLTGMLGYMEAVRNDPALTVAEKEKYLAIAAAKGQNLSQLIQEFFELSKLESDDAPLKLEKLNLTNLLQAELAVLYQDFLSRELTPEIMIPDSSLWVWGEPASIRRVFQNLIHNALIYGKEGGVIGVTLREDSERIWVDVWDRGPGIAAQDLPRVFERLYSADSSRNKRFKGSGLGLTIAKKLVEKQKGTIMVTSVPWEKTVFSFSFIKYTT